MKNGLALIVIVLLLALVVTEFIPQPSYAIWQVFLNEHFEEDQRNPTLLWPWFTDQRGGNRKRWGWNPRPPHRLTEGTPTDHCWGVQDYIYNSMVVRDDNQSMWCAYTNHGNVNNPFWPEDDDYQHNQNAWMWWGPVDLSTARAAKVSFWTLVDLANYAYDSLSVVVVNDPNFMTSDGDDFRENVGIAWTFARGNDDWMIRTFSFDTLKVNGEETSMVGNEADTNVYLAFVWHSNGYAITGKGAFIDDVVFLWDDGLFDLYPVKQEFGYPGEDSITWNRELPRFGDEVYVRLQWDVEGVGETNEFNIECYFDGELVYTEAVTGEGDTDEIFITVADTLWTFTEEADHEIFWVIDAQNDVEETREQNNQAITEFPILWNPAPLFNLTSPNEGITDISVDQMIELTWTVNDSNNFDNSFSIYLYVTTDTTGYSENPEKMMFDYTPVMTLYEVGRGEGSAEWNLPQYYLEEMVHIDSTYFITGFAMDSDPANLTSDIAPGRFHLIPPNSVKEDNNSVLDYSLSAVYPNPFNSQLTIEYTLLASDNARLSIFDLAGREVATLVNGITESGFHTISWKPEDVSAGVYLIRLDANGRVFHRKAVYMP